MKKNTTKQQIRRMTTVTNPLIVEFMTCAKKINSLYGQLTKEIAKLNIVVAKVKQIDRATAKSLGCETAHTKKRVAKQVRKVKAIAQLPITAIHVEYGKKSSKRSSSRVTN